jgi:[histone H3]-lysine36 N-dimethyltransferase SETMAR
MDFDQQHLLHILLFLFREGKSAAVAHRTINSVYGNDAIGESTCQKWFSRFKDPAFTLKNLEDQRGHNKRERKFEDDTLETLLEEDSGRTQEGLAQIIGVDQSTISRRLVTIGFRAVAGKWVPHKLSEVNKNHRLNTCISLLARQKRKSFLYQIVTGDESWVYYDNTKQQKYYLKPGQPAPHNPNPDLHGKKALLCIWWDQKGILFHELLPQGETVNAALYSTQLQRLQAVIKQKRPFTGKGKRRIILLHDNARPHVAKSTRAVIEQLGWEVLPHPAYSPDLAPSDYHLFLGLKTSLRNIVFKNLQETENAIVRYFESKTQNFFQHGIRQLPGRWEKVVAADGDYFD